MYWISWRWVYKGFSFIKTAGTVKFININLVWLEFCLGKRWEHLSRNYESNVRWWVPLFSYFFHYYCYYHRHHYCYFHCIVFFSFVIYAFILNTSSPSLLVSLDADSAGMNYIRIPIGSSDFSPNGAYHHYLYIYTKSHTILMPPFNSLNTKI